MAKKDKLIPINVNSREAMEAVVNKLVELKLKHKALEVEMAQKVSDTQQAYQASMMTLATEIERHEIGAEIWCNRNRALFGEKKSLDFLNAVVGFRTSPHKVEKLRSKETWGTIAKRLLGLPWGEPYVREPEPEVSKETILKDRATLTEAQLREAGLEIVQEESFYIDPKADVLETTSKPIAQAA